MRVRPWIERADPRYFQIFLITLLLVLGELRYSILGGFDRLATALGACIVSEMVLSRFLREQWPSLLSAYVSGISLALLIKPQGDLLWPFALGGFIAIGSKYVLQYRNRHLWNPTNLAISLLLLAAPASVSVLSHQWGNEVWTNAFIWLVGLLVVRRARVLHVTVAYALSFVLFAVIRSTLMGLPVLPEVAPLTGPMYQLVAFFMVTDPRTTVGTVRGRVSIVVLVALVEAGIRIGADLHVGMPEAFAIAPPILALAIVGPLAMFLDLRRRGSGPTPQPG